MSGGALATYRPSEIAVSVFVGCAVMVGSRFCVGVNADGSGPDFLRPNPRVVDRGGAAHSRCLRGVRIQRILGDNLHPIGFPVDLLPWIHVIDLVYPTLHDSHRPHVSLAG